MALLLNLHDPRFSYFLTGKCLQGINMIQHVLPHSYQFRQRQERAKSRADATLLYGGWGLCKPPVNN